MPNFTKHPIEKRALKIALLSPKGPLYRHKTGIFRKDLRAGPLTLTTLAALIPSDIPSSVTIYDEGIEGIPQELEADLIGITLITGSALRGYELAKHYRAKGIPVVLGGPHVTLVPDEAQAHGDSIVVGYAEESWPQLLRDFVANEMKPRYSQSPTFSLSNVENLPFARRDLLKRAHYKTTDTFEATRGCIHRCDFCVVPNAWGSRPYQKPIAHVIDDIRRNGAKKILFYDLNLFADFTYARELLTALIPLKIQWFGLSTTLIGRDQDLLQLAARSGCRGLLIGFESVSEQTLKGLNKGFNDPKEFRTLIERLHSMKILVNGTFVFGNDTDGTESFQDVQDFVIESKIDLPRFAIVTPFPGTPLFTRLKNEGRIQHEDWSKYDGQHVVFHPRLMSSEELQLGHEKVWKAVYSWRSIASRARMQSQNLLLWWGANTAYRFYAHNLSRFYSCNGSVV